MTIQRRKFLQLVGAISSALFLAKQTVGADLAKPTPPPPTPPNPPPASENHAQIMEKFAAFSGGNKLVIAMLVYPGMYLQDLVGPLAVFESLMNRDIHLVWKDKSPVGNVDARHPAFIPVQATTTFADCPHNLDVLFVPGGVPGTFAMMQDHEVLSFLKDRGDRAQYVTSVCTGSLILGAAGLLKGYQATSHWLTLDSLSKLGAIPVKNRVVIDRNRITGGGVTAGLDFGLTLVAKLRSQAYAEAVQLYLEYDPQPPFNAGSTQTAPREVVAFLEEMFSDLKKTADAAAIKASATL